MTEYIAWLDELRLDDLERVGGKNASLGEMIGQLGGAGVSVPGGFATTAVAFEDFLSQSGLADRINQRLSTLDVDDVDSLRTAGREIRDWVSSTPFQPALQSAISDAFSKMSARYGDELAVAVRSSATAEDLPDASFAGQQETYLNVSGVEQVTARVHDVFASLYNDRAIAYRVHQGFEHHKVALSAGVQLMVRSDLAASGVLFTLDTESGFRDVVFITSAYGLGETVVQGAVNPDEFYVYKPALRAGRSAVIRRTLGSKATEMTYAADGQGVTTAKVDDARRRRFSISDDEVEELARQALIIEEHYDRPMDIEWAKDGHTGELFVVQARPETVRSRDGQVLERYQLQERGEELSRGRSIGQKNRCRPIAHHQVHRGHEPRR